MYMYVSSVQCQLVFPNGGELHCSRYGLDITLTTHHYNIINITVDGKINGLSAYEMQNNFCLFERLFKIQKVFSFLEIIIDAYV